jgi:hypothetical protein
MKDCVSWVDITALSDLERVWMNTDTGEIRREPFERSILQRMAGIAPGESILGAIARQGAVSEPCETAPRSGSSQPDPRPLPDSNRRDT